MEIRILKGTNQIGGVITEITSEKEKILAEIDNQLEYVFKRLKAEGATYAPSKTTEFLEIMKHTYNK